MSVNCPKVLFSLANADIERMDKIIKKKKVIRKITSSCKNISIFLLKGISLLYHTESPSAHGVW